MEARKLGSGLEPEHSLMLMKPLGVIDLIVDETGRIAALHNYSLDYQKELLLC